MRTSSITRYKVEMSFKFVKNAKNQSMWLLYLQLASYDIKINSKVSGMLNKQCTPCNKISSKNLTDSISVPCLRPIN
jgi:hypothetical protein